MGERLAWTSLFAGFVVAVLASGAVAVEVFGVGTVLSSALLMVVVVSLLFGSLAGLICGVAALFRGSGSELERTARLGIALNVVLCVTVFLRWWALPPW